MADQKISELPAILAANVAGDDVFPIVDVSASETKNILASELSAFVTADFGTQINGNLTLGTTISGTNGGLNTAAGRSTMQGLVATPGGDPDLQQGIGNSAFGADAMSSDDLSADYSIAFGYGSLYSLTSGYCNSGGGVRSLFYLTTGRYNATWGCDAGFGMTTCDENTALGAKSMLGSLLNPITGGYNTGCGSSTLYHITSGEENVSVGGLAGYNQTIANGNTNVGYKAGESQIVFGDCTAIGHYALQANLVAGNTSVGSGAAKRVTTATGIVAVGEGALSSNITGNYCTAVGSNSQQNATGEGSSSLGHQSSFNLTTGTNVTTIGNFAGYTTTTGSGSTYVGDNAGFADDTGDYNTGLGKSALASSASGVSNSSGLGHGAEVTGSNQVQLGNASTTTYAYGAVHNRSDERDKTEIQDTELGLDFLNALRPVDYKWNYREQDTVGTRFHHGLIAQEVKQTMDSLGVDFGGFQDHSINGGDDVLSLGYGEIIGPLIKAVQELSARIVELENG